MAQGILSSRWYLEKVVKKARPADIRGIIKLSEKSLIDWQRVHFPNGFYNQGSINVDIFDPEAAAQLENLPTPDLNLESLLGQPGGKFGKYVPGTSLYYDDKSIPLLFIPNTTDEPLAFGEKPINESIHIFRNDQDSLKLINQSLNIKAKQEDAEIYHCVIKIPVGELLQDHWGGTYPVFSNFAFANEISNGNMIQILKQKTLEEFISEEKAKNPKVGTQQPKA